VSNLEEPSFIGRVYLENAFPVVNQNKFSMIMCWISL